MTFPWCTWTLCRSRRQVYCPMFRSPGPARWGPHSGSDYERRRLQSFSSVWHFCRNEFAHHNLSMNWWLWWTRAISPNWYPETWWKDHQRLRPQWESGVRRLHTKIGSVIIHIRSRRIDRAPYLTRALMALNDIIFAVSSPSRSISTIYVMTPASNSCVRTLPIT